MKKNQIRLIFLSLSLLLSNQSFSQKYLKGFYEIDTLKINNSEIIINNDSTNLKKDKTNRIIIFDNDSIKVAIVCKVTRKKKYTITKTRIEVYENDKWRKPPLQIHRDGFYIWISRWESKGGYINSKKSPWGINWWRFDKEIKLKCGKIIKLNGTFTIKHIK